MFYLTCNNCSYGYYFESEYDIDANCLTCGCEHSFYVTARGKIRSEDFTVEFFEDDESCDMDEINDRE